jgi:hypothetical protein
MMVWCRRREVGLAMSRQLMAACCLTVFLGGIGRAVEPLLPRSMRHLPAIWWWGTLYPARRLRYDIAAKLARIPGKHLVFVKYSPDHCFCEEWVFNGADIASQRIVYARPYTYARGLTRPTATTRPGARLNSAANDAFSSAPKPITLLTPAANHYLPQKALAVKLRQIETDEVAIHL